MHSGGKSGRPEAQHLEKVWIKPYRASTRSTHTQRWVVLAIDRSKGLLLGGFVALEKSIRS